MSPPNTRLWMSSDAMTVVVEVRFDGVIVKAPPIVHRFLGQPIDNLRLWMSKQPGFKEEFVEEVAP